MTQPAPNKSYYLKFTRRLGSSEFVVGYKVDPENIAGLVGVLGFGKSSFVMALL